MYQAPREQLIKTSAFAPRAPPTARSMVPVTTLPASVHVTPSGRETTVTHEHHHHHKRFITRVTKQASVYQAPRGQLIKTSAVATRAPPTARSMVPVTTLPASVRVAPGGRGRTASLSRCRLQTPNGIVQTTMCVCRGIAALTARAPVRRLVRCRAHNYGPTCPAC